MAKKHLSVIIVPHTKTSTRTLCFSRRTLKTLAVGGVALGLVLAAVLVDYVRMNVIRGRYKALKAETAEQRTTDRRLREVHQRAPVDHLPLRELHQEAQRHGRAEVARRPDHPGRDRRGRAGQGGPRARERPRPGSRRERPPGHHPGDRPEPEPEGPEHREQPQQPAQLLRERQPPPGDDALHHADGRLDQLGLRPPERPLHRAPGSCTGASTSRPTSATPSWPRPTASSSRSRRTSTWARTSRSATATASRPSTAT
ncbi:MAG: hypothetical protein M0C28_04230 [Candidatus Moduliflexus flocculans]|nr:hypothetical protein [Candidatus Moduliflexus flocculans]